MSLSSSTTAATIHFFSTLLISTTVLVGSSSISTKHLSSKGVSIQVIRAIFQVEDAKDCSVLFYNCLDQSSQNILEFETISNKLKLPMLHYQLKNYNTKLRNHNPRYNSHHHRHYHHYSCSHVKLIFCLNNQPRQDVNGFQNIEKLSSRLDSISQPKYDIYILLSLYSTNLQSAFHLKSIQNLRFKMGLHLDSGIVYQDPKIWTSTQFFESNSNIIPCFSRTSINLNGHHLKVSGNTLKPFIMMHEPGDDDDDDDDDGGQDDDHEKIHGGTHYMILKTGSLHYNYTLEFDIDPKRGSGKKLGNGSYTGMMHDVLVKGYDIALITRLVEGQVGILDMTSFNSIDTLIFLTSYPKAQLEWEAMAFLFTPSTWLLILFIFICTGFIYFLSLKIQNSPTKKSSPTFLQAITIPYAIGLSQVAKIPKKTYFISAIWLIYILNLNIAYNSNLISYLNFPTIEPTPKSFEELASRPDYNLTFNYINSGQCFCYTFFITSSNNSLYNKITSRFMNNLQDDTGSCVLTATLNSKNVCIGWRSVISIGLARNATIYHEKFTPIYESTPAYVSFNSIGFNRNSKYTDCFSRFIIMLRDTGLVQHWYNEAIRHEARLGRYWLNSGASNKSDSIRHSLKLMMNERNLKNIKPFELKVFLLHFSILAVGCLASGIIFVLEIIIIDVRKLKCRY